MDHIEDFKLWEQDVQSTTMPEMPADPLDHFIHRAIDPISGAQTAQHYAESQPQEALRSILIHSKNELNTQVFSSEYKGALVEATIEHNFGEFCVYQNYDMRGVMDELRSNAKARIVGRLAYFMHVSYGNKQNDLRRPILSLYLDSGSYVKQVNDSERLVSVPNFLIVPVTSIIDYTIKTKQGE